jgi:DNA-binding NarL/FixJ family response regulator
MRVATAGVSQFSPKCLVIFMASIKCLVKGVEEQAWLHLATAGTNDGAREMSNLRQGTNEKKRPLAAPRNAVEAQRTLQPENCAGTGQGAPLSANGTQKAAVVVVDPVPLFRAGLVEVLRSGLRKRAVVAGEAVDVAQGVELAKEMRAAVLVLGDASVPEAREAVRALPGCAVVVLVSQPSRSTLVGMLGAGVAGIAPRDLTANQLVDVVEPAAAAKLTQRPPSGGEPGKVPISFSALPVEADNTSKPRGGGEGHALTPKEREVLAHLARGASNNEIAKALYLKPATVKTHLTHIYAKLGARGRHDALARALSGGVLR